MGMEKEKPFNCETCGKRYKNLNGLKYVSYYEISIFKLGMCRLIVSLA